MSQETVSLDRIQRAQRALFEAIGHLAVFERMIGKALEPSTAHELMKITERLEGFDNLMEQFKKAHEPPEPPPLPVPGPGRP